MPDPDRNPPSGYGPMAKLFHWLVAALLVAQYAVAWTMPGIRPGTANAGLVAAHLSLGTAILAVVIARLLWRETHAVPAAPSDLAWPMRMLSRLTHYGLYALLLVLPVLGWISASARGFAVSLAGVLPLPALSGVDHALAARTGGLHGTLALALLGLVGLHVGGALYHGVVRRDGVLGRMLPGRSAADAGIQAARAMPRST